MIPDDVPDVYVTIVMKRATPDLGTYVDHPVAVFLDPLRAASAYGGRANYYLNMIRIEDGVRVQESLEEDTRDQLTHDLDELAPEIYGTIPIADNNGIPQAGA